MRTTFNTPFIFNPTITNRLPVPARKILKKIEASVLKIATTLLSKTARRNNTFNFRQPKVSPLVPTKVTPVAATLGTPVPTPATTVTETLATGSLGTPVAVASPQKRKFKVTELKEEQLQTTIKVTAEWLKVATEKAQTTQTAVFYNSKRIISDIHCSLTSNPFSIPSYLQSTTLDRRVMVCYDQESNTQQAIAIVSDYVDDYSKKPYLYVNLLATNPANIKSSTNPEKNRVSGAASAIFDHLIKVCQKEGKEEIALTSVTTAVTFYEKIGLKQQPHSYAFSMKIDPKNSQTALG